MWAASPTCSSPQLNVTKSPGFSSTMSSRSGPMRSFGPGQVLQDRDRSPRAAGGVAHAAYRLLVLGQRAVGVVQPGHVHPGTHHREQRLRLARGGADGGDDLCAAHCLATVAVAAGARGARV